MLIALKCPAAIIRLLPSRVMCTFLPVAEKPNFPKMEEDILQEWERVEPFKKAKEQAQGKPDFNFYDGPPFATGLPHYGHILAGTIKDVILRHAQQCGFRVDPRFGWDCHGVPIESIIDKELGIKGPDDVMKFGLAKYNEACRGVVLRHELDWYKTTARYGRWIDTENNWKTMDVPFMESVWWVFKQLWEKNMVYRAHRVIAYSTGLCTPLSNFEAAQNYKDVPDPSIVVRFRLKASANSWILCWTTTPWSLPANVALCVHPDAWYIKVRCDGQEWICGKERFEWVCSLLKKDPKDFRLVEEIQGRQLQGIAYEPLFNYYLDRLNAEKCFRVVCDTYVSTTAGTMVVHQAPAFGEDDMRVCKQNGLIPEVGFLPDPVDNHGCFTSDVPDFEGVYIKEADKGLIKKLRDGKGLS